MRYDLLWAKRPHKLGIGLHSRTRGIQQKAATLGKYDLEDARIVFKLLCGEPVFSRLRPESQAPSRESKETETICPEKLKQSTYEKLKLKADLEENI